MSDSGNSFSPIDLLKFCASADYASDSDLIILQENFFSIHVPFPFAQIFDFEEFFSFSTPAPVHNFVCPRDPRPQT